jgi:hypothetical protein
MDVQVDRRRGRGGRRGEARLPAAIATVAAIALYSLLPDTLILGPRYVVPALEVLLLVALFVVNPRRLTRETRWSRVLSLVLVGLVAVANLVALVLLIRALVATHLQDGRSLLLAALQVWLTNIFAFGLLYWELDRGGPVARSRTPRDRLPPADFRFSQDENHDAVQEVAATASKVADWVPSFVDYLYVSITNSTAFSPTDTMPLSTRAKLFMSVESVAALITSVLVIARGVGILQ